MVVQSGHTGEKGESKFMQDLLKNKRALVTGGTRGIGLEVARSLISAGCAVVVCGRNPELVDSAVSELQKSAANSNVAGFAVDVSDSEAVAELFRRADQVLSGLDILINNAGSGIFRPAAELTIEEWDHIIGTNLSGAFYCSREALSRFRNSGGGWIINISSLAGRNPMAGGAAYNASKFGLNGMSEAIMLDHRDQDVRVSYIMPGSVDTDFGAHGRAEKSEWKIAPEDIAEIVLDILRKPGRTLVSRVEVRPSKPPRK
jgi:3-oxoacyl-[acyl-carrier protein] reductase